MKDTMEKLMEEMQDALWYIEAHENEHGRVWLGEIAQRILDKRENRHGKEWS